MGKQAFLNKVKVQLANFKTNHENSKPEVIVYFICINYLNTVVNNLFNVNRYSTQLAVIYA